MNFILFIIIHIAYAYICKRNIDIDFYSSILMFIISIILKKKLTHWNKLGKIKLYSLIIGQATIALTRKIYSNNKHNKKHIKFLLKILRIILAINIAEVGVLELYDRHYHSGLLLSIISILTPKIEIENNLIGVKSILWWSCYYSALSNWILSQTRFKKPFLLFPTTIPYFTIFLDSPIGHMPYRTNWIAFTGYIDGFINTKWNMIINKLNIPDMFTNNKSKLLYKIITTTLVFKLFYYKVILHNKVIKKKFKYLIRKTFKKSDGLKIKNIA